jgi:hypothetical protein
MNIKCSHGTGSVCDSDSVGGESYLSVVKGGLTKESHNDKKAALRWPVVEHPGSLEEHEHMQRAFLGYCFYQVVFLQVAHLHCFKKISLWEK